MEEILRKFLSDKLFKRSNRTILDNESLFQSKLLSTRDFIELTIFIEEQFGTQVKGAIFGSPEFDTVHNIVRFIEKMHQE